MPKRKVIRSKTKLEDGTKFKTKTVYKKDGTVKVKTKGKLKDGTKVKTKQEGPRSVSRSSWAKPTVKSKPPKGTARKAKKAGKKAAKAIGKALKSGKKYDPKKEGKAQTPAQSNKKRVNPKGAALGAIGGSAFSRSPNQITRKPIRRKTTRAIAAAPPPPPPILRKTAKKVTPRMRKAKRR